MFAEYVTSANCVQSVFHAKYQECLVRSGAKVHLLFPTFRRPHCVAVVCWFLLRGCVFRPDDSCQERFSWFLDWIQKV